MKAAAYIRVSTGRQVAEGTSLDNQQFCIRTYASLDSVEDIDFFIEEGVSGRTTKNRPQLNLLLDGIEAKKYDRVYIYALSRLGRNTHDALALIKFFKEHEVTLVSYMERWDTSTAIGQFSLNLMISLSEFESNQISERVKSVVDYNKSNGLRYSGPIFGFNQDEKKLVPIEVEANAVKLIFRLRENKSSMIKIATDLNDTYGIPTKGGFRWRQNSVRRVLEKEELYRKEGII